MSLVSAQTAVAEADPSCAPVDAEAEQKQSRSGKQTRGAQKPGARKVQDSESDFCEYSGDLSCSTD